MEKRKSVRIDPELWYEYKKLSAIQKKPLQKLIDETLINGLKQMGYSNNKEGK